MKKNLIYLFFVFSNFVFAQNTGKVGINTSDPKSTLDVNVHTGYENGDKAGISFPTLTGDQIEAMLTTDLKPGTIVYSSSISTSTTPDVNATGLWYWTGDDVKKWEPFGGSGSDFWSLNGNLGTNPPTNFIGTIDPKSLVFKTSNMFSGIIEPVYVDDGGGGLLNRTYKANTVIGSLSLNPFETIGERRYNSVFGAYSLYQLSSGEGNTALGAFSMDSQASGSNNIAIGFRAILPNTEGSNQLSIGNSIFGLNIADPIIGNELIGIGTMQPKTALDVNGMAKASVLTSFSVSPETMYHPVVANYASLGGTWDAPQYVQSGNTLGAFINRDYKSALDAQANSTPTHGGSDIYATATENFKATAKGSNMKFLTTPNGTNLSQERMRIEHNGNVGVGTPEPKTTLDVNGMAKAVSVVSFSVSPETMYHPVVANYASLGGTWDAPQYLQTGNTIGAFINRDYKSALDAQANSTPTHGGSDIYATATENFTATAKGSNMKFLTTPNGTNLSKERMRIENDGNVGINVTTPTNKLHVVSTADPVKFEGLQTSTEATDKVVVSDTNGVLKVKDASAVAASTEPWFNVATNAGATSNTQDIYQMGKVGVGTSTPVYNLDVANSMRLSSNTAVLRVQDNDADVNVNTQSAYVRFQDKNQNQLGLVGFATGGQDMGLVNSNTGGNIQITTANNFQVANTTTTHFIVKNDGTTGISTITPNSTLEVNGSVSAKIRTLATGTIAENDYTIMITGAVSLPAAASTNTGRIYNIINGNTNSNTVSGTFMINGGTFSNYTLNNSDLGRGIVIQSTGSAWLIISRY